MTGRISVVAVSYNSGEVLSGLLDSLPQALAGVERYRVVVVDNMSGDSSVGIAEEHDLAPLVIQTGRNAGYAAAINIATADMDEGDAVLVLNPDIRLAPGSVRLMLEKLESPSVGIVAPRMIGDDGRLSHSIRREPSLLSAWSEALVGGTLAARIGVGEVVRDRRSYSGDRAVEWTTGAALLIAPALRRRIGGWDERYFLYSEEVDYMRRARDAGFRIAYVPEAVATHIGGESNHNPMLYALLTANRIRYYARYHSRLAAAAFRAAVVTGEMMRAAVGGQTHRAGLRAALAAGRITPAPARPGMTEAQLESAPDPARSAHR